MGIGVRGWRLGKGKEVSRLIHVSYLEHEARCQPHRNSSLSTFKICEYVILEKGVHQISFSTAPGFPVGRFEEE